MNPETLTKVGRAGTGVLLFLGFGVIRGWRDGRAAWRGAHRRLAGTTPDLKLNIPN